MRLDPATEARLARWAPLAVALSLLLTLAIITYLRFTDRVHAARDRRQAGPAWAFPSRVYSADVPLEPGRELPDRYLASQLAARGYVPARPPLTEPGTWAVRGGGIEIALRGFTDAADPAGYGGPERVRVVRSGTRVARVQRLGGLPGHPPPDLAHPPRLEPMLIALLMDEHRVRRTWVPLSRVPAVVRQAVIAAEDRRFARHSGLDVRSNLRALLTNVRAGGVREGGSTLTQQLARGLFLGRERTLGRKLAEAALAVGLETTLSKDELLEMYLNSVYWGQDGTDGVAGIAEAARHYFDVPVDSLNLDQAALLAGLIPGPNAFSPFRRPRLARRERNRVLADMTATGVLDADAAARARRRPLGVRRGAPPPDRFPWYVGAVREELQRRLSPTRVTANGLAVFTGVDLVWQPEAEGALTGGVAAVERWRGRQASPLEGAFVALDPHTGRIACLVGGRGEATGTFNRATQALRQPGSAIKPVVYAAALDGTRRGTRFDPASTMSDRRRAFPTPEGPWSPRNDEGDYHDQVTLVKALAKSLNVATANLVDTLGPRVVARYVERFGLGRPLPVASIGLGTHEVTLTALAGAYATFPNGGLRMEPTTLRAVLDARGPALPPRPAATQVIPEVTAALMIGMLEDVVVFGVAYPLRKVYGVTRPVGGKTGTTNEYRDAWFVGFTPSLVAGVWIGYDQPAPLNAPAAEIALPVWADAAERMLGGFAPSAFPETKSLVPAWIDPWTGGVSSGACPSTMRAWFLPGQAPTRPCTRNHAAEWAQIAARDSAARDSGAASAVDSLPLP